jgi:tetratricopeptide (TPR) repeat protein
VAVTLSNLANAHRQSGDAVRAVELLERAAQIERAAHGENHVLLTLGLAYGALGNKDKQQEMLKRALGICESQLGRRHHYVGVVLYHLCLVEQLYIT